MYVKTELAVRIYPLAMIPRRREPARHTLAPISVTLGIETILILLFMKLE